MGRFAELKQYADKVTKFNQGKALNDMHDRGEVGDLVYRWSQNGICGGLAANWLKKARRYRDGANDALMQRALGVQYLYSKGEIGGSALEHAGVRTADVFMPILPAESGVADYIRVWKNNDGRTDRGAYISFKVSGRVSGSHAVAARRHGRRLNFYDANCGWYIINEGQEPQFFEAYTTAYQQIGLTISSVGLTPVH